MSREDNEKPATVRYLNRHGGAIGRKKLSRIAWQHIREIASTVDDLRATVDQKHIGKLDERLEVLNKVMELLGEPHRGTDARLSRLEEAIFCDERDADRDELLLAARGLISEVVKSKSGHGGYSTRGQPPHQFEVSKEWVAKANKLKKDILKKGYTPPPAPVKTEADDRAAEIEANQRLISDMGKLIARIDDQVEWGKARIVALDWLEDAKRIGEAIAKRGDS